FPSSSAILAKVEHIVSIWKYLVESNALSGLLAQYGQGATTKNSRKASFKKDLMALIQGYATLEPEAQECAREITRLYTEDGKVVVVYGRYPNAFLVRIARIDFVDYMTDVAATTSFFSRDISARVDIIRDQREVQSIEQELSVYGQYPYLYAFMRSFAGYDIFDIEEKMRQARRVYQMPGTSEKSRKEILRLFVALLAKDNMWQIQQKAQGILNHIFSLRPSEFPSAVDVQIVCPGQAIDIEPVVINIGFDPFREKRKLKALRAQLVIYQSSNDRYAHVDLKVTAHADHQVRLDVEDRFQIVADKGYVHVSVRLARGRSQTLRYIALPQANRTFIVQPDISGKKIYQLWPNYVNVYHNEDGSSHHQGSVERGRDGRPACGHFQMVEALLPQLKAKGYSHVYVMGAYQLERPENIQGQAGPDASLFSPYSWRVSREAGGEEAFRSMVTKANELGLGILVDVIPHLNQNSHELPEWATVKAYGPNGQIVRRLATDGGVNHEDGSPVEWHDSVALNFRDKRVLDAFAALILKLAGMGVAGIRGDVFHNYGNALPVSENLQGREKVFGYVTSWQRADSGGFKIVNQWRNDQANPLLTHLVAQTTQQYPQFIFIGENYSRYEQLIKSGIIPMNSGTHDDLEKVIVKDEPAKHILNGHFYWLFNMLPFGAQLVTALETHDYYRIMDRWQSYGPHKVKAALWAWLATIKGALLVYNGQEKGEVHRIRIDNWSEHNYEEADRQRYYALKEFERVNRVTYEDYWQRLFSFYQENRELYSRQAKTYLFNVSHDRILAFARYTNDRNAIFVINTSWHLARVTINLADIFQDLGIKDSASRIYRVSDIESGEEETSSGHGLFVHGIDVRLKAYDVAVLRLEDISDQPGAEESLIKDSFARYEQQPFSYRTQHNYASRWMQHALNTKNREMFVQRFAFLAKLVDTDDRYKDLWPCDLTMMMHELTDERTDVRDFSKTVLASIVAAQQDEKICDVAAKVLRWIDIGIIVDISPEVAPFSKGGGLANVPGQKAEEFVQSGLKVYIISPLYSFREDEATLERTYVKDETIRKFDIRYVNVVPQVYMGRHGSVPAAVAYTRKGGVNYLFLDNPNFSDSLYGQLRGNTTDRSQRVTKEHEQLRSIFLSLGALEAIKQIDVHPSFIVGNDWMCAPLMAHLNCDASLYRHDPHFKNTQTIFFVHNNGQDYQFKLAHDQNGVELLDNLGLPRTDHAWFLDPHHPELMNFTAAAIRHARFVGTVSPGQMEDFLGSDNKGGGEGLCHLFHEKNDQGRLFAITNGLPLEVRQKGWLGFSFKDVDRSDRVAVKRALDEIKALQKEARQKIATEHPDFFPFSNGTSPYLTDDDHLVVMMVTRVTEQKGVHYVASFVRRVIHSGKKVVFLFVGAGDQRLMDTLTEVAREFPGRVGYPAKFVSDQQPIYYHMYLAGDIYLAFSTWEPGGISPMEALAFMTAVLASDKQGHKSTIRSLYIEALKDILGVFADEQGVNGARFPIDDGNFDNTVDNAYQAFETLFAAWEDRFVDSKWDAILENAFFSDNSWERVVGDFEALFKNIRFLGRVSSSIEDRTRLFFDLQMLKDAFDTQKIIQYIPEFKALSKNDFRKRGHFRFLSVYKHIYRALFSEPERVTARSRHDFRPEAVIRAALVFHDIGVGEPSNTEYAYLASWSPEREEAIARQMMPFVDPRSEIARQHVQYLKHPYISVAIADKYLESFGFSQPEIIVIRFLIWYHSALSEFVLHGKLKDLTSLDQFLEEAYGLSGWMDIDFNDLIDMLLIVQLRDSYAVVSRKEDGMNEATEEKIRQLASLIKKGSEARIHLTQFLDNISRERQNIYAQYSYLIDVIKRKAAQQGQDRISDERLAEIFSILYRLHAFQRRRQRKEEGIWLPEFSYKLYIEHVIDVTTKLVFHYGLTDEISILEALFHDVKEDTRFSDTLLRIIFHPHGKGIVTGLNVLDKTRKFDFSVLSFSSLKNSLKEQRDLVYMAMIFVAGERREQCIKSCDVFSNFETLGGFETPEDKLKQLKKFRTLLMFLVEASYLTEQEKILMLRQHHVYIQAAEKKEVSELVISFLKNYTDDVRSYGKRIRNAKIDLSALHILTALYQITTPKEILVSETVSDLALLDPKMRILEFLPIVSISITPVIKKIFGHKGFVAILREFLPHIVLSYLPDEFRRDIKADVKAKVIDSRIHIFGHRMMAQYIFKYACDTYRKPRRSSSSVCDPSRQKLSADIARWHELQNMRSRIFSMRMPRIAKDILTAVSWVQDARKLFTDEEIQKIRQNPIVALKWIGRKGIPFYRINDARADYSQSIVDRLSAESQIDKLFTSFPVRTQKFLKRRYIAKGFYFSPERTALRSQKKGSGRADRISSNITPIVIDDVLPTHGDMYRLAHQRFAQIKKPLFIFNV
ncbi:MAG TPA: glycogen/starch synthase, partial [Candidatus Omnitrophota bacterium]|nr:glycogen/starch synthase [Candidatus Omnitrophota bacterium]